MLLGHSKHGQEALTAGQLRPAFLHVHVRDLEGHPWTFGRYRPEVEGRSLRLRRTWPWRSEGRAGLTSITDRVMIPFG
jgi:hypothetical protein